MSLHVSTGSGPKVAKLAGLIAQHEASIAALWTERVMHSYPDEAARFLQREKDPFANPSGQLIREAAGPLVRALCDDIVGPTARGHLDRLMRLRSVQDLSVGEAVAIVPELRRAVLEVLGEAVRPFLQELVEAVERLTVAAFEVYCDCREQFYEVRLHEKDRHFASLRRRLDRLRPETGGRPAGADAGAPDPGGRSERGEGE